MKITYLIVLVMLFYSCKKEVDLRDQLVGNYNAKIIGREAFGALDTSGQRYITYVSDSIFGHFTILKSEYPDSILLLLDSNLNFEFMKGFDFKSELPNSYTQKIITLKSDTTELDYYDVKYHHIYTNIRSILFTLKIEGGYHNAAYSYEITGNKVH